jgi:PiT family inorganic phosphate transporter
MFFIYLTSGLFLGWSLGANDAANIFGTAVGSKMVKFKTAAIIASVFILLGAVIGGAGAAHTLGKLGSVNAIAGSFTVAFAAAITVAWMTKLKLPVSTSQSVVGAIIGWNFFSNSVTDYNSLTKIMLSWLASPIIAAIFSVIMFKIMQKIINKSSIHIIRQDVLTRFGLIVFGAFASYSLGANNIANVMGVFVDVSPFKDLSFYGLFTLSSIQILFAFGGIAIGVGVFTYSKKVMLTVGDGLVKLSPMAALIVVLSQAVVLFLFSSEGLEYWLHTHGLPTIPLVPVSSSQTVIGAVIGIGLAKGGRNIKYATLGRIASGWVSTPVIAGLISFTTLFFIQNIFQQTVYEETSYMLVEEGLPKFKNKETKNKLTKLLNIKFENSLALKEELSKSIKDYDLILKLIEQSEIHKMKINYNKISKIKDLGYSKEQLKGIRDLDGKTYNYTWELYKDISKTNKSWKLKKKSIKNKLFNKKLKSNLEFIYHTFKEKE